MRNTQWSNQNQLEYQEIFVNWEGSCGILGNHWHHAWSMAAELIRKYWHLYRMSIQIYANNVLDRP